MRIAIVGAAGQLGSELVASLGPEAIPLTHGDIEITDRGSVDQALARAAPDAVINAAAYNLVDQAENEPEQAYRVNALGPRTLARFCAQRDVPLLHVSTDYVFGRCTADTGPLAEADLPSPDNAYAVSKLAGEHFVLGASPRNLVVRTCGLYGRRSRGTKGNFVDAIRRLALERDELQVVDDQRCTPTRAADLCRALLDLLRLGAGGLVHATNSGDCTWFELASTIVQELRLPARVQPVRSDHFPRPARRPAFSVLDCARLTGLRGAPLPHWREALRAHLEECS